jgi:GAF domain-containing protein
MVNYIPPSIINILKMQPPEMLFMALMPAIGIYLDSDRCFLFLRNPNTSLGKVAFCWIRNDQIPMIQDEGWKLDAASLSERDPMYAAALRAEPSIVIEDVETASPDILNKEFESKSFGHRALIHAHICHERELWGILQPSIFGSPRHWTQLEQQAIAQIVEAITPCVITYVSTRTI